MAILIGKRQTEDLKRFRQILKVFFKQGFEIYIERLDLKHKIPIYKRMIKLDEPEKHLTKPERFRKAFEELGGAFIKFGQLLSLRPDLVPIEYCEEFKKLQDNVPPVPYQDIIQVIESDLGKPIKNVFRSFSEKPIAGASIGQVHSAVLKTGEKVVVKIKRPNIDHVFLTDIDILHYSARLIEKKFKLDLIKPVEIVNEFKRYTHDELDFRNEAKNIERFASHFRDDKHVTVPKVYHDFVTDNVLVMEHIDGIRISNQKELAKAHYNKKQVLQVLVDSIFRQLFTYGIFHADPHPGNILVLGSSKIAFLDFGIMGHLTESMREKMTMLFISFLEGDINGVADGIIDLGMTDSKDFNKELFKQDVMDRLSRYYDISLSDFKLGDAFTTVVNVARENGLSLPSNLVLLLKALVTLEGLGEMLYPRFNLVQYAKPVIKEFIRKEMSIDSMKSNLIKKAKRIRHLVSVLPEQTLNFLNKLNRGEFKVEFEHKDLESLIYQMERTSNKIVLGVLVSALIIGSGLALDLKVRTIYGIPYPSFIGFFCAAVFGLSLFRQMLRR